MTGRVAKGAVVAIAAWLLCAGGAWAADGDAGWWEVITLRDYNTRVVVIGVTILGATGGMVGTFLLLRKRSLLSDAVSHATLPGLALAFLIAEALGANGKSLPVLLGGALVGGLAGMVAVVGIRRSGRIKDDAALAIVLSVFFGLGISLTVAIQQLPTGNAAGLTHFIYGKTASMTAADAWTILGVSVAVALLCAVFFKEFTLLCFDENFAASRGLPVLRLDLALMALVVTFVVAGLAAVGLLLVVAMLIIPPAAARFWSERLTVNAMLAAAIGALSGLSGAVASALLPRLPAGAVIVVSASVIFVFSLIFGMKRGVLAQALRHRHMVVQVGHQHLMRAFFEIVEDRCVDEVEMADALKDFRVSERELLSAQSWSPRALRRILARAAAGGLITVMPAGEYALTALGRAEARKIVRNHRLWELYLIEYADIAPSQVHHDADQIEHVVDPQILGRLEEALQKQHGTAFVPVNPERA
jgi:manganese/zinc/iron transport system permease protein